MIEQPDAALALYMPRPSTALLNAQYAGVFALDPPPAVSLRRIFLNSLFKLSQPQLHRKNFPAKYFRLDLIPLPGRREAAKSPVFKEAIPPRDRREAFADPLNAAGDSDAFAMKALFLLNAAEPKQRA